MNKRGQDTSTRGLLTIVLMLFSCGSSYSQDKQAATGSERPSSCEHVTMFVDESIVRVQKMDDPNSTLIVIFRLGKKEKNRSLNLSRMKLVEYSINRRQPVLNFVLATSPARSEGLGRADIFAGGRLIYVLYFAHKAKSCELG